MFAGLEARPVLACAYGLLIGGLLVVGLGVSQSVEADHATAPVLANPWFPAMPHTASVGESASAQFVNQTDPASSVNPFISSGPPSFLFDVNGMKGLKVAPASATFP